MKLTACAAFIVALLTGCQSTSSADSGKDVAVIDGLSFTELMLSPVVKLNWPDLTRFDIYSVDGAKTGAFSAGKATVSAGMHTLEVTVEAKWHRTKYVALTFEAKAGKSYWLRPVYQGDVVEVGIQDKETNEVVAKTW